MAQLILCHEERDGRHMMYFALDGEGMKPVSPQPVMGDTQAEAHDKMRHQVAAFDFAVNGPVVEVVR